jgi:hypothetical protein
VPDGSGSDGIDPNLVYSLSQLWDVYDNKEQTPWLYHLKELGSPTRQAS